MEITKKRLFGAEANLFVKGSINSENEKKFALSPLTNQELRELFYGLCNQLIDYTGTSTLAAPFFFWFFDNTLEFSSLSRDKCCKNILYFGGDSNPE